MSFTNLRFFLDKNQSHGQKDEFLRQFLLRLNLCRPLENLDAWQFSSYIQKSVIIIFHKIKNFKILIINKFDLYCSKEQNEYIKDTINVHQQNLDSRHRLIFIYLTDDLDSGNILGYQLIENQKLIEFLQWRAEIEIREWLESCAEILEEDNLFKRHLNSYIRELKIITN